MSSALGRTTSGPFARSTKVPAFGQAVTWRFSGGSALAGRTMEIQSLTSSRPTDWTAIAHVVADATGTATYATSFDRPAFLSLRAVLPAEPGSPGGVSSGLQASWRGTGACPVVVMGPGPVEATTATTTSPDGTRYEVVAGWDAAGDWQSTLVASVPAGRPGSGWRHVFEPCYGVSEPVFDSAGTAFVVASLHSFRELDSAIYSFGSAGPLSASPYRVSDTTWGLVRSAPGGVYAVGAAYALGAGGTLSQLGRSYVALLDTSGHPAAGWPYSTPVPLSNPAFGPDGTAYLVAGYIIGAPPGLPASLQFRRVLALAPNGTERPGWPFVLPAGVGPLHTSMGEGGVAVGEPPVVGPDGTIYVAAGRGAWGEEGDLVYALAPDGAVKPGWPYATVLSDGALLAGYVGGSAGALPPVPVAGGTVYLATRAGSGPTIHDELQALGPGGSPRPGWPYVLAARHGIAGGPCMPGAAGSVAYESGECWLGFAAEGVLQFGVSSSGTTRLECLEPAGKAIACPAE